VEDDLRAVSGERYCDFCPDAAGAAGHEDHFAVQVGHLSSLFITAAAWVATY
jgi:hypothetical protein